MRNKHVHALHVLQIDAPFHFLRSEIPAEAAERFAETDFFAVNMCGGRAEPFRDTHGISVDTIYAGSVQRAYRGKEIAFRLHERFDKIFSVEMPDMNQPVFMQKIGNNVEIALLIKFRDGIIIIASGFHRDRPHVLPQAAKVRADIVSVFFDKPLCEIVRPDDGIQIFTLLEIVLIESGLVGEESFNHFSPLIGKVFFIFFVRMPHERTRNLRIEQIHVRIGRIGGAMSAFFLAENEHFPLQCFRTPRFIRLMLVIGDIEEIIVVMHGDHALDFGIRLIFHRDIFPEHGINFIHGKANRRKIGIFFRDPAARIAAGPIILVVDQRRHAEFFARV